MKNKGFIESQKNNKTKKKTKWTKAHTVVFIMIVFFTFGSIFGIYGGISSCKTAKADEVTTTNSFIGSSINFYVMTYTLDGQRTDANHYQKNKLSFYNSPDGTYNVIFDCYSTYYTYRLHVYPTSYSSPFTDYTATGLIPNTSFIYFLGYDDYLNNVARYESRVVVYISGDFDCAPVKIKIGTSAYDSSTNLYNQYIEYYDKNDNFISFSFRVYIASGSYYNVYSMNERTYYTSTSFTDEELYQQGYDDGRSQGFNDGYQNGITVGEQNKEQAVEQALQSGYQNGYNQGKTDGIASANDYTFLSLLGAVVDAPLNSITSFFDFNLLGFNMANFFWAIMTCIVILGVIKVIFGRGG